MSGAEHSFSCVLFQVLGIIYLKHVSYHWPLKQKMEHRAATLEAEDENFKYGFTHSIKVS